jgi:hypothetical protein
LKDSAFFNTKRKMRDRDDACRIGSGDMSIMKPVPMVVMTSIILAIIQYHQGDLPTVTSFPDANLRRILLGCLTFGSIPSVCVFVTMFQISLISLGFNMTQQV